MRCLLAAIRCEKGDLAGNLSAHLRLVDQAAAAGCQLAVFPEMSLTGSADPATRPERLISLAHPTVTTLVTASAAAGVGICFGIAERAPDQQPHITQVVADAGRIIGVQRKRHLGEGEEAFAAAAEDAVFEHRGVRFGVAVCAEAGFDAPFDHAAEAGASLVLFPAAPGLHGRRTDEAAWQRGFSWWEECGLADARRLGLWIAMTGQAGSTADEDFPGLAAMIRPDGTIAARLPDWHPGTLTVDIPLP